MQLYIAPSLFAQSHLSLEMSPKAFSKNERAASPLFSIIATVVVVTMAVLATLFLAAAPASAAGVGSTTLSKMATDKETYSVAPGETVTIKVSGLPAALAEVNFDDPDGFNGDKFFTVTVMEDATGLNASVKIKAADDTPLGEYLVELVAGGAGNSTVKIALTVEHNLTQVVTGNVGYLGGGVVLIVIGYVASAMKNKTARRVTKPLSVLMYISGAAAIAWVAWLAVEAAIL